MYVDLKRGRSGEIRQPKASLMIDPAKAVRLEGLMLAIIHRRHDPRRRQQNIGTFGLATCLTLLV